LKNERNIIMKKTYFQPEVNVASIALQSMVLAGSPNPGFSGDPNGGDPGLGI
jgi:hypothetical protein